MRSTVALFCLVAGGTMTVAGQTIVVLASAAGDTALSRAALHTAAGACTAGAALAGAALALGSADRGTRAAGTLLLLLAALGLRALLSA